MLLGLSEFIISSETTGSENRRELLKGCREELGQSAGFWSSKIGIKHFINPEHHEHRGVPIFVKSETESTSTRQ